MTMFLMKRIGYGELICISRVMRVWESTITGALPWKVTYMFCAAVGA
jgi:hypothetical protein